MLLLVLCVIFLPVFLFLCYLVIESPPRIQLKNKHVIITGGSQGIGFEAAKLCVQQGANVTIVARTKEKLVKAAKELEKLSSNNQRIQWVSADVSDFNATKTSLSKVIDDMGSVDVLLSCAGSSIPGRFLEQDASVFESQMKQNYLGTVHVIKIVAPYMKKQKFGRIVITSSMAGLIGITGLSAYCASKFALRGLAEALQMELSPFGIYISLALPPDTETPGFEEENKIKPLETKLVSEGGGLFKAEQVAEAIVDGVKNYKYFITNGFDGFVLSVSGATLAPVHSVSRLVVEILLSSILRFVGVFYRRSYNKLVRDIYKKEKVY